MWALTCTVMIEDGSGNPVSLTSGTTTGNAVSCQALDNGNSLQPVGSAITIPAGSNSATSGDDYAAGTYTIIVSANVQGTSYPNYKTGAPTVTFSNADQAITITMTP